MKYFRIDICGVETEVYSQLDSTQLRLLQNPKNNTCFFAFRQSAGIGSRGNSWIGLERGLYFSFCLAKDDLPLDLPLHSCSIYFGFHFKEVLNLLLKPRLDIWLKWPNDLYLEGEKIGGVMVSVKEEYVVCGVGLNLINEGCYRGLGQNIDRFLLLYKYFLVILKRVSWMQTFEKYRVEFNRNLSFKFHHEGVLLSLENASLCQDGSLCLGNKKIYGFR